MDVIDYIGGAENAGGKYPVTVQGLDFIQQQILTLQQLGYIGGECYVVKVFTDDSSGIVFINGTFMPLMNKRTATSTHISYGEQCADIEVGDELYADVKCGESAFWVTLSNPMEEGNNLVRKDKVREFKSNVELTQHLRELQAHVGRSIPFEKGIYTLSSLNNKKNTVRIMCEVGSQVIDGNEEYIIDVVAKGNDSCIQYLTTTRGERYSRVISGAAVGDFRKLVSPVIELKVMDGQLYLKKNFTVTKTPQGDYLGDTHFSIVLLRKKRRSRSGGVDRKSGKRRIRAVRQGWSRAFRVVLDNEGVAGEWTKAVVKSFDAPKDYDKSMYPLQGSFSPFSVGQTVRAFLGVALMSPNDLTAEKLIIRGQRKKKKRTGSIYAQFAIGVIDNSGKQSTLMSVIPFKLYRFYKLLPSSDPFGLGRIVSTDAIVI